MKAEEIQAKATIVAALIAARVVELPTLPKDPTAPPDKATRRMRQLTDYIYDVVTGTGWPEEGSADV